jgi:dTDP-4-dehydrorhamnose reductase
MQTLLITGVSGMLGWTLAARAAERFRIIGTCREHHVDLPAHRSASDKDERNETLTLDITDHSALRDALEHARPAAVVHLAALADPNACERSPQQCKKINLDASIALAEMCERRGIPMVFASTDLVFAGDNAPYAESDETGPINTYGLHKAAAERAIRVVHRSAAICRLPLLFGDPSPPYATTPTAGSTFVQSWANQLRSGNTLKLFTDEYRTPASAHDVSQGLLLAVDALLQGEPVGTLHLGGDRRLSRYDFGFLLCDACNLPRDLVEPCLQSDVPMPAPRAKDVSLASPRAKALGYTPAPIPKALRQIKL